MELSEQFYPGYSSKSGSALNRPKMIVTLDLKNRIG